VQLSSSEVIYDEQGNSLSVEKVIPNSWTLLVLIRHAECIECNLMFHELNLLYHHLQEWGCGLVCIGNGKPPSLKRVRTRLAIDPKIALFCQPTLDLHKKLQLHNGIMRSWGGLALWSTAKALINGHLQTSLAFPMSPQSGIGLLNPNREPVWVHRSEYLGDIPNYGKILEQIILHKSNEGGT
jgi:hypothetical protein